MSKKQKVIQMIPATGWYAVYKIDAGDDFLDRVAFWALTDDGEVSGWVGGDYMDNAEEQSNFLRYEYLPGKI